MSWFSKAVKRNTKWAKNKAKKLKKLKLKDVLDSDIVEGALSMVPGGKLVNTAIDAIGNVTDSLPDEIKKIKGSDIIKQAVVNKLVPASSAKGSTIRITSKSGLKKDTGKKSTPSLKGK